MQRSFNPKLVSSYQENLRKDNGKIKRPASGLETERRHERMKAAEEVDKNGRYVSNMYWFGSSNSNEKIIQCANFVIGLVNRKTGEKPQKQNK